MPGEVRIATFLGGENRCDAQSNLHHVRLCRCSYIEVCIESPSVAETTEARPVYFGRRVGEFHRLADISMEVDGIRGYHLIEFDRPRSPCGMIYPYFDGSTIMFPHKR